MLHETNNNLSNVYDDSSNIERKENIFYIHDELRRRNLGKRIDLLPKELQILISEYNVFHREDMNCVNEELLYNASRVMCDNDMCEREISKLHCNISSFLNTECYFCDEDCEGYGMWSIRYDYRKRQRRLQIAATNVVN